MSHKVAALYVEKGGVYYACRTLPHGMRSAMRGSTLGRIRWWRIRRARGGGAIGVALRRLGRDSRRATMAAASPRRFSPCATSAGCSSIPRAALRGCTSGCGFQAWALVGCRRGISSAGRAGYRKGITGIARRRTRCSMRWGASCRASIGRAHPVVYDSTMATTPRRSGAEQYAPAVRSDSPNANVPQRRSHSATSSSTWPAASIASER